MLFCAGSGPINPLCGLPSKVNGALTLGHDHAAHPDRCCRDNRPGRHTCPGEGDGKRERHRDCRRIDQSVAITARAGSEPNGPAGEPTCGRPADRILLIACGRQPLPSAQLTLIREAASGTSRRNWLKSVFAPGASVRTGAFMVQL